MIRVGQIGLGSWGSKVLRTLTEDLRDEVTVRWTAGRLDWPTKLKTEVDAVVVCVPPDAQPMIAKAVLEAGLSVFLEKPLALDALSAQQIHDAATMCGLPVLVDHVWLFHPMFERLKHETSGKVLRYVECVSGDVGPDQLWPTEHPALWDWGAHDVALALALGADLTGHCGVQRDFSGNYRLQWKKVHISAGNRRLKRYRQIRVNADDTLWVFDGAEGQGTLRFAPPESGFIVDGTIDRTPPLTKALKVWLAAVKGDAWDGRIGTALGLQAVSVLEQAQNALEKPG